MYDVCTYVCAYDVCTCAPMMCVYMYTYDACVCIYACAYMYICTCVCTYACVHDVCKCMYMYIHIYVHMMYI